MVCGLCAPAQANTTANAAPAADVAADGAGGSAAAGKTRIALLLPTLSETFGPAAQALRAGFMAAHEREPDGIEVHLVENADGAQNVLTAYAAAQAQNDIVVGPLARADVAVIAKSGKVDKPTLALTQPEASADADIALPPRMLALGLSIEDEARQLAAWAGAGRKHGKAMVIASGVAWQRRAGRAFAAEWQELGLEAQPVEIASSGGYLSAAGLGQLKKRLQDDKPALLFIGLDAFQAQQVQLALGHGLGHQVYGTSQLNPWSAADWRSADKRPEMNGVRLVDIPWLLQPDHPATMIYPRPVTAADSRANPDLERLYALGIDAYRVAREIALRRSEFELDGVTGKLSVSFGKRGYRFRRIAQPAAYQDGVVAPLPRTP
ncbi:hypothetical protein D3878_16950 [Noviherbaspirillum sedimenti]|uniref:LppC family lipoprotein n=1 Tax=Noviherbaspirillum sedimenti TaxID=2320865 RepID=A0A3A3G7K0_9BURK|nr:hypothetical protein D3878_16950 [Noviherbaspirillum sedimenti]